MCLCRLTSEAVPDGADQPCGTRIDQEEGRAVAKLSVANAVTGVAGEARVWPQGLGRYRAKVKWKGEHE